MYTDKLRLFFKNKKLKQKTISELTGYTTPQISYYLSGKKKFNGEFIVRLLEVFPDIDLHEIFKREANDNYEIETLDSIVFESSDAEDAYQITSVLESISVIEDKLEEIKKFMAQKSHYKL